MFGWDADRRRVKDALHRQAHVADSLHSLFRVLRQTTNQIGLERGRERLGKQIQVRVERHDRCQGQRYVLAVEGTPACQHLIENDTEREDVSPSINDLAPRLFRSHIRRCPDHHPHLGGRGGQRDRGRHRRTDAPGFRLEGFGQPKVEHLHHAIVSDLDVGWFQIPVDDPLLMRGFQRLGDLLRYRKCFINWYWSLRDPIRQCRPLNQFEDQRLLARSFFEAVDVPDVGMVQRGEDFGFALEANQAIRIVGERLR